MIYKKEKKETKIISAFPACGKTHYFENNKDSKIILDSDSSKFSWIYSDVGASVNTLKLVKAKIRNPEFPKNYIEHIKENIGKVDYIFVSSHDIVRKALNESGIDFIIVYPEQTLKAEWVGRCFLRGSGEKFCKLIADNWDGWIAEMDKDCVLNKHDSYRLKHNEFLSDAMEYIG